MKSALSLVLLACLILPAAAAPGGASGVEFLKLGGGARPLAMGNAFTAIPGDVSAIYYNPANLSQLNIPELLTMNNQYLSGTTHQTVAFSCPTKYGIFGIAYSGFGSGNIQGYDLNGGVTSIFNTASSSLNLSFAKTLDQAFSLGGGVRTITERLDASSASTWALDAGLLYKVNPNFNLGLAVTNLGSGLKFISENTPLPTAYRVGAGYSYPLFGEGIKIATDLVFYPDVTNLNVGAEYLIKNRLALRTGYDSGRLRAGIGLRANQFSFDYAYLSHQDLGSAHQFSIGILFGQAVKTEPLNLEEGLKAAPASKLETPAKIEGPAKPVDHLSAAMKLADNKQYEAALEQVKLALNDKPGDAKALAFKKKLELIIKLGKKK